MSRYELTVDQPIPGSAGPHSLAIGWDPPMRTYFLQLAREFNELADDDEDEDPMIEWIGGHFDECIDVDQLLSAAGRYSTEAAAYRDRLLADRADRPR